MTEGLAIELAKRKMEEIEVGNNYLLILRHLQIPPVSKVDIQATNELYLLIDPPREVKVCSKAGIFNLMDQKINEMQYIHRGTIQVINQSVKGFIHVKFLQVIPTLKNNNYANQ